MVPVGQPTWVSSDVHGLQVPALDDSEGESTCGGQVAEREHNLPQVNTFLMEQTNKKQIFNIQHWSFDLKERLEVQLLDQRLVFMFPLLLLTFELM